MMKGLIIDDNTSNLTFASGHDEIISSRNELSNSMAHHLYPPQLPQHSSASTTTHPPPPPNPQPFKKKRNLPGNPDPEAEVIALSPKALLATNRFVCEVCKKGFQRDQNLQLHRRGHNLPWKLKQRSNKDVVKKKVYVCPEVTCVHHDPSRALGDLTGIKKHFFRKHGDKKWKCEKCSKRYAVHSDWKAHSKICGTREYRCDCGTLFSRRDSFITHRAFCDGLAQETTSTTAKAISALQNNNVNNLFSSSSPSQQLVLQSQLDSQLYGLSSLVKREHQDSGVVNAVPQWLMSSSQPPLFSNVGLGDHHSSFMQGLTQKPNNPTSTTVNMNSTPIVNLQSSSSAFASATALLQKAAQMGATMNSNNNNNNRSSSSSSSSPFLGTSSAGVMPNFGGQNNMNSLGLHYGVMGSFGGSHDNDFLEAPPLAHKARDDGLTRDFLGLRSFPRREFFSMTGLDQHIHLNSSASFGDDQQKNHDYEDPQQTPWQG